MALHEDLTDIQQKTIDQHFDDVVLIKDHSWGDVDTTVLEVTADNQHCIIKAFGEKNHHLEREIQGHREFLKPLVEIGRAPEAALLDQEARLVITSYLPGRLVEGDASEWQPDAYLQAGKLLALMHGQASRKDPDVQARSVARSHRWLTWPHRISDDTVARIEQALEHAPQAPVTVVPTHGDWQPRNWLIHRGLVSVIDFGRASWRPADTDMVRMTSQQFMGHPELAEAFFTGYGHDPRQGTHWHYTQLFEAVGTAVYAHGIGAADFEAQGHRMIAEALKVLDY